MKDQKKTETQPTKDRIQEKETKDNPHACHDHGEHGHNHECRCSHDHGHKCASHEESKEIQILELTELLQRIHADFVNYKRRVEEDSKTMAKCASEDIVIKLLPLLDNFELALQHKDSSTEFTKGIELIYSQLQDILKKEGVSQIIALNKKFNPKEHEALMVEKSDKEEGIVIEEFQKGYKIGDKVIRHSKVKIAKK